MFSPAPKPDIGPTGKPTEAKPNPPVAERFQSPPVEIYDLEAFAGAIFEGINKENWEPAEKNFMQLETSWHKVKEAVGEKKGVKEAEEAFTKLSAGLTEKTKENTQEALNQFMSSISDIGKSYKLSPISDLIAVNNNLRSVSYYIEEKNWSKASSKIKGLEGAWQHAKPAMEQVGVLSEATKIHARINQLKDSVIAENQGSAKEQIEALNESLSILRQFYQGK